jgi:hypothetical protein
MLTDGVTHALVESDGGERLGLLSIEHVSDLLRAEVAV